MSTPTKPTVQKILNADPEDDLDDLDDVLSEFQPSAPPPTATTKTAFTRPRNNTRVDAPPTSIPGSSAAALDPFAEADEDALSTDFARELALGMESLMREITGEATATGKDVKEGSPGDMSEEERSKAFKAAWEAMLVEGMDANLGEPGVPGLAEKGGKEKAAAAGGFQDKIKQAMDKLKESESKFQAPSSGAGSAPTPENLENLLQSLGDLGLAGGGSGEDEKELAGFLESMMGQLMSKDVLYEPLKELSDSFPPYLQKPPAPISAEDMTRFQNQQVCVKKILAVFEKPGYDDNNPEHSKQIVDLMSEMQTYGSPPAEIMGPLPDGIGAIPGLGEDGCVVA